jgi:hypothetical protein
MTQRTIEPYRDRSLPERFLRWIETIRARFKTIPNYTEFTGSPEGVIFGQKADRYYDLTADEVYVKTTEGGNTGWVLITTGGQDATFQGLGQWRYRTTTGGTPSAGQLEFDNVDINLATEFYLNVTNDNGVDMTAFLGLIQANDLVYIQVSNDSAKYVVTQVGLPTLAASVYTFPIVLAEGVGGGVTNNTPVSVVTAAPGGGGGSSGEINTDINTATPPTTEAVTGNYRILDLDGTDLLATFGFKASNALTIFNEFEGAGNDIQFGFGNNVSNPVSMALTFEASLVLTSNSSATGGNAPNDDQIISMVNRNATQTFMELGVYGATDSLLLRNLMTGQPTVLEGRHGSLIANVSPMLIANPHGNIAEPYDGQIGGVIQYYGEQFVATFPATRTRPVANGVLEINTDGAGTWERVLTLSDLGGAVTSVFTRTGAVVALVGDYSAHYLVKTGGAQTCTSDVTINGGGGLIIDDPTINLRLENSTDLLMFGVGNTQNFRISQSATLLQMTGSGFAPPDLTYQIQNFVGLDINVQTYFQPPLAVGGNSNPGSGASWNAPHGTAPTTPLDGDFWTTTLGGFLQLNGATQLIDPSISELQNQNGNYTLVLGDKGKTILKGAGGAGETITIPANASVAFPLGTWVAIDNDGGGDLSIAITTDVLAATDGTVGTQTLGDNQVAVIQKIAATKWRYSASDI